MTDRLQRSVRPTTPLCPTTPGGIPVRLLVDAEPRSRARRALPLVLFLALAVGVAAVALAGCGAPAGPRPPAALVNRAEEVGAPAPAARCAARRPPGAASRRGAGASRG